MRNRVAVFIDNGYIEASLPHGYQMDFLTFSRQACGDRERLRTYVYDCMPWQSDPPTDAEYERYERYSQFVEAIETKPRFQMRLGELGRHDNSFVQKRVDILLTVDLVRLAWAGHIGYAVLVSGDSDFVPAVNAAKDAGVITTLYYSPHSVHDELIQAVDEHVEMDDEFLASVAL